jgi:hypothetical protein
MLVTSPGYLNLLSYTIHFPTVIFASTDGASPSCPDCDSKSEPDEASSMMVLDL